MATDPSLANLLADLLAELTPSPVLRNPRLRWHGPPGTHDMDLGLTVLDQICQAQPHETVAVPRFDKPLHGGEGDRVAPEFFQGVDIVLFEGWFLGMRPLNSDHRIAKGFRELAAATPFPRGQPSRMIEAVVEVWRPTLIPSPDPLQLGLHPCVVS